jgi:DNA-binding response OmpR family regulator
MKPSTILVIEDQASVRGLLVQILEEAGYQVYQAADGRQGLERFQAQPVDLVLTDLEMPEMSGLDVIVELTRTFLTVKIIAMSGHSAEKLQTARLLGARWSFAKPLNLPELLRAVEYELQQ